MKEKLTSRKFWLCVSAFLGSIATSIAGIQLDNDKIATLGIVCGIISTAIYAFCEAWVDGKRAEADGKFYESIVIDDIDEDDEDEKEGE